MNLEETVIYFGLEGELLCGSISVLLCVQYFQYEGWFWYGCQLSLSSEYTGHCPLDGWLVLGCLEPKLDVSPGFIFAPRCHCPVQGRVRSPVVGVEPLWVGWIKLALECMPCPKEGDRRSKYDRDVTADLGTSYLYRHWQLHPEAAEACIPFSAVFIQVQCEAVVRLGWGSGWLQQLRWLSCCLDSGLPLCRLLPEPVCPRAGVNCRVEWSQGTLGNESLRSPAPGLSGCKSVFFAAHSWDTAGAPLRPLGLLLWNWQCSRCLRFSAWPLHVLWRHPLHALTWVGLA